MTSSSDEPELRRCDGCFTDRTCYEYEGLWLCKGPQRCWSKRRVMNKNKDEKRRGRR
jgi:hypothetical protein